MEGRQRPYDKIYCQEARLMIDLYNIEGTENICSHDLNLSTYNTPLTWPTFQEDYEKFKNVIIDSVEKKNPLVMLRIFDGEFHFLKGNAVGNVARRHVSDLSKVDIQEFKDGFLKADYVMTQLYPDQMAIYNSLFPNRRFDFPMEYAYAVVANKWITKEFKGKIGMIGGEKKINLIKNLFEHQQYRDYVGIDGFNDYISVPEKFACDNVGTLEKEIGEQLEKSSSDIFIFGIGISKLALAHRFKNYKNAVYLDVGCGISALAGTTSLERPYFGGWTNFRLNGYDYAGIDPIDYADTAGKSEIRL